VTSRPRRTRRWSSCRRQSAGSRRLTAAQAHVCPRFRHPALTAARCRCRCPGSAGRAPRRPARPGFPLGPHGHGCLAARRRGRRLARHRAVAARGPRVRLRSHRSGALYLREVDYPQRISPVRSGQNAKVLPRRPTLARLPGKCYGDRKSHRPFSGNSFELSRTRGGFAPAAALSPRCRPRAATARCCAGSPGGGEAGMRGARASQPFRVERRSSAQADWSADSRTAGQVASPFLASLVSRATTSS
jgi:hypothetical protein